MSSPLEQIFAVFIKCFLAPLPYKWHLFDVDLDQTSRLVMNIGSYLVALVLFSMSGIKFFHNMARDRGYLANAKSRLAVILGSVFAVTLIVWPILLHISYFSFCDFYPWPTAVFALTSFYRTHLSSPQAINSIFSFFKRQPAAAPGNDEVQDAHPVAAPGNDDEVQDPRPARAETAEAQQGRANDDDHRRPQAPAGELEHHESIFEKIKRFLIWLFLHDDRRRREIPPSVDACRNCVHAVGTAPQHEMAYILRQPRMTRSGLVYAPPSQFLPVNEVIKEDRNGFP